MGGGGAQGAKREGPTIDECVKLNLVHTDKSEPRRMFYSIEACKKGCKKNFFKCASLQ